jgi:hypothetical protein
MQTLEDIEKIPKNMLSVMDVREFLCVDAFVFRQQVRKDKKNHTDSFGFPVILVGERIKIPKEPFVKFMHGK